MADRMKIFTCTDHDNFWPVGCASVVVAKDQGQARTLLSAALTNHGLKGNGFTLQELDTAESKAVILWDGNY